ncbi:calcium-binding protein [Allomesorhizobium camelthorni]|uniref:Calcium-binding protein n=1 Tax=Allomesorhizobium camelthorni TaxID=475069 RepID=A0A6G4WL32_9HYPH|nr:calcium-binding protein [Mesorhizobium camelthorni]NGO54820.1 calcium-binding protein [Mesorhizobium camelthorni]
MATVTYSFENFVPEFVVNSTAAGSQYRPDIAVLSNGDLFFTFETDSADPLYQDVVFRRFDASGNALDASDGIVSVGPGADDEDDPAVAVLSNGNVVVVNEDNNAGGEDDVEFHVFDPSGASLTQSIVTQAEGQATDNQPDPVVAALSGGGFAVVYTDEFAGSGTNTNVEFVVYNNDGSPRTGLMFAGGGVTSNTVSQPAAVGLTNGNFVVTWTEDLGDGDTNVKFRVFNSVGQPASPEVTANEDFDDQYHSVVAALPDGGFAVAYVDQYDGNALDTQVEVKFYDAVGNAVGATGFIDLGDDLVSRPDIAVISNSYVLVSYTSNRNGNADVFAQVFDFSGNKVGEEFNLEVTPGTQIGSSLAGLGGGRFFAAWEDSEPALGDTSGYHIAAQGTEFVRTTIGNETNETLTGDDLRDIMEGGGGNDLLNGGAGNDTMAGGTGDDIYIVAAAGDTTVENAGEGTDTVRSYINWTLANNVERLELQGSGNLNGTGNTHNNTLVGNSGNNLLNGGGGNDYMVGGTGNDIYIVAAAGDVTAEDPGQGTDTVRSYINWTLGANVERLELQGSGNLNGTGNNLNNTLVGNSGANSLSGGDGNDYIVGGAGNDTLAGGAGNDTLIGGAGSDILNGGTGNDRFDFDAVSDSPAGPALRDSIVGGFSHGFDHIDLATIDANTLAAGDQAFSFIGSAAFSGVAGQLRYTNYSGNVIVDADVNGDSIADMQILVAGTNFMTGTDFIL